MNSFIMINFEMRAVAGDDYLQIRAGVIRQIC
jgi:hypothetical protein